MGYNIGIRLIEDFLARSSLGRCADFREVGEVVAKVCIRVLIQGSYVHARLKVGFKSFLNITPTVTHTALPSRPNSTQQQGNVAGSSFVLTLEENPLAEFVELPEDALDGGLWFSNVLCGVIRGALEMVRSNVPSSRTRRAPYHFVGTNAGAGRVSVRHTTRRREHGNARHVIEISGGGSTCRRRLDSLVFLDVDEWVLMDSLSIPRVCNSMRVESMRLMMWI